MVRENRQIITTRKQTDQTKKTAKTTRKSPSQICVSSRKQQSKSNGARPKQNQTQKGFALGHSDICHRAVSQKHAQTNCPLRQPVKHLNRSKLMLHGLKRGALQTSYDVASKLSTKLATLRSGISSHSAVCQACTESCSKDNSITHAAAAAATLQGKTHGFVLRLPPQHKAHATSCSHSNAIWHHRVKKRIELRTQEQALLQNTWKEPNGPSRNRRTNEVAFIAGCSHFTRVIRDPSCFQ